MCIEHMQTIFMKKYEDFNAIVCMQFSFGTHVYWTLLYSNSSIRWYGNRQLMHYCWNLLKWIMQQILEITLYDQDSKVIPWINLEGRWCKDKARKYMRKFELTITTTWLNLKSTFTMIFYLKIELMRLCWNW